MGFDLTIAFWKLKIHWDSNSQSGSSLGSVEVYSLTLSHTPESMKCDFQAWLLARTFVSPCLGYKLKVKVTTTFVNISFNSSYWEGHELDATLAITMVGQKILKAKIVN
jgi:hypothetical protein